MLVGGCWMHIFLHTLIKGILLRKKCWPLLKRRVNIQFLNLKPKCGCSILENDFGILKKIFKKFFGTFDLHAVISIPNLFRRVFAFCTTYWNKRGNFICKGSCTLLTLKHKKILNRCTKCIQLMLPN